MKRLTEISWDILPANFEDFIADAKEKMSEPESAAALFVVALKMYMESPEEGKKCLDFITYKSPSEPLMYLPSIESIAKTQIYLPDSYFSGASPENGYHHEKPHKVFVKSDNSKGLRSDMKTVYIGCSGSGNYRPITLRFIPEEKTDRYYKQLKPAGDMWFVADFISLLIDVRKPVK